SGYIFKAYGAIISWCCRKQSCVALSSTEAEFMALSDACKEAIWLRSVLGHFQVDMSQPTIIFEDNQSCLALINPEGFSNRTKHIDTRRFFVKDHINNGTIKCEYCKTEEMLADMCTKPL
ncbi:Copia protein, partial [Camponotus floridanus]